MKTTCLIVLISALFLGSSASAAPPSLNAEAIKGAQVFFKGLASDIEAALAKREGARAKLLAKARVPSDLGREIDAIGELAREAAGMKSVRINTFVLSATTWFGILPLKEIEYHLIVVPERIRLLRTLVRDGSMRPFGRVRSLGWQGPEAKAFRTMASEMTQAMTDGDCRALPRIGAADHPYLLPKKPSAKRNTLKVFKRFRKSILRDCESLTRLPHHRTTVRLRELRGSVVTEGARNVPFHLTLTHDKEGALQLFHLKGSGPKGR